MNRFRPTVRYSDMQDRRSFLTAATGWSMLAALGIEPVTAIAGELAVDSENDLIAKMDPSIWVSWGKGTFPNAQGATGANKSAYMEVGFQYQTFHLVPYAIVHRSTHFLDGACLVAEYAFEHQRDDGSFEYHEPNGTSTNPNSPPSALTLFYYDFGHSLLVLANDDWYLHSADCGPYRARIDALRPKIARSLDWLLAQRALLATDSAASNRTLAHGLAFYFVGKALGRGDAMDAGSEIVSKALDNVTDDGVFPEAGGFDSSYQAVNVLECEFLALHVDHNLRSRLWQAIRNGVARERRAMLPTGEASTVGNSRISQTGESYMGHRKSVNGGELMLAFAYYGIMANDPTALDLTSKIQDFYGLPRK